MATKSELKCGGSSSKKRTLTQMREEVRGTQLAAAETLALMKRMIEQMQVKQDRIRELEAELEADRVEHTKLAAENEELRAAANARNGTGVCPYSSVVSGTGACSYSTPSSPKERDAMEAVKRPKMQGGAGAAPQKEVEWTTGGVAVAYGAQRTMSLSEVKKNIAEAPIDFEMQLNGAEIVAIHERIKHRTSEVYARIEMCQKVDLLLWIQNQKGGKRKFEEVFARDFDSDGGMVGTYKILQGRKLKPREDQWLHVNRGCRLPVTLRGKETAPAEWFGELEGGKTIEERKVVLEWVGDMWTRTERTFISRGREYAVVKGGVHLQVTDTPMTNYQWWARVGRVSPMTEDGTVDVVWHNNTERCYRYATEVKPAEKKNVALGLELDGKEDGDAGECCGLYLADKQSKCADADAGGRGNFGADPNATVTVCASGGAVGLEPNQSSAHTGDPPQSEMAE